MSLAELKLLALPAACGFAGAYASTLVGSTNVIVQIILGVAGVGLGLYLAKKL